LPYSKQAWQQNVLAAIHSAASHGLHRCQRQLFSATDRTFLIARLATDETYREIPEIVAELRTLEQKVTKITKNLDGILHQLKIGWASES